MNIEEEQKSICKKYRAEFRETPGHLIIGVSANVLTGELPIHGLRHPIEGGTSGWYIWAGEYSDDPNFFQAHHIEHLYDLYPWIIKYMGLAPGWRFLVTPIYEDVWEDLSLLEI